MKIAIIGAGGLGGYFGAKLIDAGHDVTFVLRPKTADVIAQDGLKIIGKTKLEIANPKIVTDASVLGEQPYVIVATKMHQLASALNHLPALVGADTAVLTLQNGVQAPYIVAKQIGKQHVLPGIARVFTSYEQPGVISHNGPIGSLTFAEWDSSRSARVEALAEALRSTGIYTPIVSDIFVDLWMKFIMVCPQGTLGAVTGQPVGEQRSRLRGLLTAFIQEIIDVALANQIKIPDDALTRTLAAIDAQPAKSTTSFHRDVRNQLPSEVDGLPGAVVELGKSSGVNTVLHELAYETIKDMANR